MDLNKLGPGQAEVTLGLQMWKTGNSLLKLVNLAPN